jgi:hypothetical protein
MTSLFDRPNYTGEELKPFAGRPGAMDAFKLPSLYRGQRIEATRPKPMLVGNTKETPIKGRDK